MSFKHIHIIGVCGTLMGAFAAFLRRQGVRVTGSDQNVYPPMSDVLKDAGVELFSPYAEANLDLIKSKPDLVVVGNVISANNPEVIAFHKRGDVLVSLPEFMEKNLLGNTRNILAAGTHGKTTTSSMLAHVLNACGRKPSYFIGGVSLDIPNSFHVETESLKGGEFVLEGDEYDTAFWDKVPKFNHYLPNDVILTSVEFDHADIYKDLDAVKAAFRGLISRIREPGCLIVCNETQNVREVMLLAQCERITYARAKEYAADFWIEDIRTNSTGGISFSIASNHFSILKHPNVKPVIDLQVPGVHNALNALAVWIEAVRLGVDPTRVKDALASFRGVKRRQEERGTVGDVLVIDDFAHHPTAVKETISALKQKYKGKRLFTVFEPRSATSRRKVFQKEYAQAFSGADSVFIAQAFDQGKIPANEQFSSQELVADLLANHTDAQFFPDVESGISMVVSKAKPGDVVAVLSNGGFGGFIPKLLTALKSR